jgi:TolB-like protein
METPSAHSLAVLPFENLDRDPEAEYLSDGITESIINSLSRLSSVRGWRGARCFNTRRRG